LLKNGLKNLRLTHVEAMLKPTRFFSKIFTGLIGKRLIGLVRKN
jgi:hypothetical protein